MDYAEVIAIIFIIISLILVIIITNMKFTHIISFICMLLCYAIIIDNKVMVPLTGGTRKFSMIPMIVLFFIGAVFLKL